MEISTLAKILEDFKRCPKKEKNTKTFLEIAGCPHYENVWSNILAFYLNPNADHGFSDILLKTLLKLTVNKNDENYIGNKENVKIHREYRTANNNRLDIVVETDNFVLGIENKVNASLYNDLTDYANTIETLASSKQIYNIVLSKYKSICTDEFINVLYVDLINQFKTTIKFEDKNKYHVFFKDFIENIENEINENPMNNNPELVKFFTENHTAIKKLIDYNNRMNGFVLKKLQTIHNVLISEFNNKIYKESTCFAENSHYLSCIYLKVKNETFCWETGVKINGVHYFTSCYPKDNSNEIIALKNKKYEYEFNPTYTDEEIIGEIKNKINQIIKEIENPA